MDAQILDMILTIIVLGFWFIFPIGMFLSVNHVDKNKDQIVRLEKLRHDTIDGEQEKRKKSRWQDPGPIHLPQHAGGFRRHVSHG